MDSAEETGWNRKPCSDWFYLCILQFGWELDILFVWNTTFCTSLRGLYFLFYSHSPIVGAELRGCGQRYPSATTAVDGSCFHWTDAGLSNRNSWKLRPFRAFVWIKGFYVDNMTSWHTLKKPKLKGGSAPWTVAGVPPKWKTHKPHYIAYVYNLHPRWCNSRCVVVMTYCYDSHCADKRLGANV